MIGFSSLDYWYPVFTPLFTLVLGLITFFSFIGVGKYALSLIKSDFPSPWDHLANLVVGVFLFSFSYQVLAYFKYNKFLSLSIFLIFIVFGLFKLKKYFKIKNILNKNDFSNNKLLLIIIIFSIIINILISIAPSTKIDELAYMMYFPSRIIEDQVLNFYHAPWEASIIPHMTFQLIALPFYSLGLVNTLNVISFFIFLSFIFSLGMIIKFLTNTATLSYLFVSTSIVGLYVSTNLVTSASNSLMILCTGSCLLLITLYKTKKINISIKNYILLCSIFSAGMLFSKITLAPLTLLVFIFVLIDIYYSRDFKNLIFFPIFFLFILPSILWTWAESGSPFGNLGIQFFNNNFSLSDPFLTKLLFDEETFTKIISDPLVRSLSGTLGFRNFVNELGLSVIFWSPIIFISFILCAINFNKFSCSNKLFFTFFIFQLTIIFLFLPYKIRHLGGIQYLPLVMYLIYATNTWDYLHKLRTFIIFIFIVPWLLIQIVYSIPLVSINFGIGDKESYYKKYIAFYDDYSILDKITEKNSEILVVGTRVNAFYSPRKIVYDTKNFGSQEGKDLYLFLVKEGVDEDYEYKISEDKLKLLEEYKIYENKKAVLHTFRNPLADHKIGKLEVYKISDFLYK